MKFVCHFQDKTKFESDDMTEFNRVVLSKQTNFIELIVGKEKILVDLFSGRILRNDVELIPALSEIESNLVCPLKPKVFRRTRVVIGPTNEPAIEPKYFFGWVGNGREQFVVFDGKDFVVTESR